MTTIFLSCLFHYTKLKPYTPQGQRTNLGLTFKGAFNITLIKKMSFSPMELLLAQEGDQEVVPK
jgi:hypothetical protein